MPPTTTTPKLLFPGWLSQPHVQRQPPNQLDSPPFSILTPILVFILYHQPPSLILTNSHPVLKMNKKNMFSYQPLQLRFPFFIPCVRHPGLVHGGPQTACLSADFCTNAHQAGIARPKKLGRSRFPTLTHLSCSTSTPLLASYRSAHE